MAVKWTEEQQQVIDTRGKNILVPAAAGSGKTAVLVARILAIITDMEHPVDIDRLLVVTFTNAAAAEMRERIRDALEQRSEEEPENIHLQRQLVLVHNARITTIHSFCLDVLRNHFQLAEVDPGFRVADVGEVALLEQEAAKEIINEAYERKDEAFEQFLEEFVPGKDDGALEEQVLQVYHFALGQPWPGEWLESCRRMYKEWEQPLNDPWLQYIARDTGRLLADGEKQIQKALAVALEPDGPYPYCKALESDLELIGKLRRSETYDEYARAFRDMPPFARLASKRDSSISEEKKQQVQELRGAVKDMLTDIRKKYYYDTPRALREEFLKSGLAVEVLTRLTERFMECLAEKKADKNILDFGDMEHLALKVLVERGEEGERPSAAAREYAGNFEEIMIDEYQDSNLVQELILKSVSGRDRQEHNLFMVGDVKQSIYRFRLARPELFMEKYKAYQGENRDSCRIGLHRNFRSREEVLEAVNYIFRQIMTEALGGVEYDADAALYPGAVFQPLPETVQEAAKTPEDKRQKTVQENGSLQNGDPDGQGHGSAGPDSLYPEFYLLDTGDGEKRREEARLVGRRIQELAGHALVWDKEEEKYRPARYGDMVILLRTVSGWAEVFGETLADMGIPCFTGSQTGYFAAAEVQTVLSYLQILDNPMQDIPLAGVLRSPMGGLTDDELAQIRNFSDKKLFYDCCMDYLKAAGKAPADKGLAGMMEKNMEAAQRVNGALAEKLYAFFGIYEKLRKKSAHTPVHELLWELLEVTGYGEYAQALPAGRQRKANLDMLVEKAVAYEATSFRGLYHFVRYIENLKKYEIDYGEASVGSETADTVRIMSIHKSKGLEFPIVFVSGLGKQFNVTDVRSRVVMHPDFGVACDWVDTRLRMRRPTLLKRAIQQRTMAENLGEELRVLYVAMTRAKEKLILTGAVADAPAKLKKWSAAAMQEEERLSYSQLSGAMTYLDWVAPAILRHPDGETLQREAGLEGYGRRKWPEVDAVNAGRPEVQPEEHTVDADSPEVPPKKTREYTGTEKARFYVHLADTKEYALEEMQEENREALRLRELLQLDSSVCQDTEAGAYLEHVFSLEYPYEQDRDIPGKLSVSELKKLSHMPEEADARELYQPETVIPLIPEFRTEEKTIAGAARGTVYHTFMENLDYLRKDALEIQLEELISCGRISQEEGEALHLDDVRQFLRTPSGQRMERAALAGQLRRECPFVYGIPASQIRSQWSGHETVLVQGIIDAWFQEGEELVVLDYKTDRVPRGQVLVDRYRAQLDYYAGALEQLTGRRVKERIIYSFYLGEDIIL